MYFRQPSSRWALWVFAAALLLKAAMPFLASASAQMQGKTLVDVCTVYGVSLVSLVSVGGEGGEPAPDHSSGHASEHCALSAVTAFASAEPHARAPAVPLPRAAASPRAHPSSRAPDACASWVARIRHGPPVFA